MYVIDKNIEKELIIKKSRFITILFKINSIDESIKLLEEVKVKYPKASHYCYCCILDNYKKVSDDKEPSKTAGMPILNVLEKLELTNILAVVVRYFGGIKLGSAGLIRAYSNSVKTALDEVNLHKLIPGYKLTIEFDYSSKLQIDYNFKNATIVSKSFKDKITYEVIISKEDYDKLNKKNIQICTLEQTWIETN